MPEAAETKLKIANIQYQQMEKPDRDYTHARRAEDEYRQLIMQFPDSKLVPEAKQRLLEVQEVLAEREFRVGRFYYLRESYPASIARLRSVVDRYPLYSKADETLYLLGQAYEGEIAMVRRRQGNEVAKSRMIKEFTNGAAESYSRILTRYPLMDRADDAKARLEALHQPVPRPTKAAVAQNKAEEDSRRESSTVVKLMHNFQKHPDVAQAARVGDPTLVDPQVVSATSVVQDATRAMMGGPAGDKNSVSIETAGKGPLAPDQPAPRSDQPPPENPAGSAAAGVEIIGSSPGTSSPGLASPGLTNPGVGNPAATGADAAAQAAPAQDANELKPNVAADPNELKP